MNIVIYLLVFGLLSLALNPVFWNQSWSAYREAIQTRRILLDDQVADVHRLFPGQVLTSPTERVTALLAHLYLAPPMFYEVGNYRAETAAAEVVYLSIPTHRLFRSPLGAGMMLALTILGLLAAGFTDPRADSLQRRYILLLLLANLCLFAGLVAVIPLAWQRYTIPLVPFVCLWAGFGLFWALKKIPLPHKE